MSKFYTLLTDAGLQKEGDATLGTPFNITTAVVGDGNGAAVIPKKEMTSLVKQVWSGPIGAKTRSKADPNTIVFTFSIPASAGPFTVREVGLKDKSGALVVVGNFPATEKPVATDGSVRDMVLRIPVHFKNAKTVSLVVDPNVVTPSNADVDRKIAKHNENGQTHQDIREEISDKTAQATETKRGTAKIASQDEVNAGTNLLNVIVPGRLKAWWDSVRTWGNIKEKPTAFPPESHRHSPDEVGLSKIPNAKSDDINLADSQTLSTAKATSKLNGKLDDYIAQKNIVDRIYYVNATTAAKILDINGEPLSIGSYLLLAYVTATSTKNNLVAYLICKTDPAGGEVSTKITTIKPPPSQFSNHICIHFDSDGDIALRLWEHTSIYGVVTKLIKV